MLTTLLMATPVRAAPLANEPRVYGKPGEGRIRIEALGNQEHWEHPGIYWLPRDTTASAFVALAGAKDLPGGEMPGSTMLYIKHGEKLRGRFLIRQVRAGTIPDSLALEDGDVLRTVPAL